MEKAASNNINPQYIDLVSRFQAVPKDRIRKHQIERLKMILAFMPWYRTHRDELTKAEREYLQSNITRVDEDDELEDTPTKDIDPWNEMEAF